MAPVRGVSGFARLQRATAELDYHHQETNFTLGLAELNARLKRRALVILFTDFVDTITAELLIESMQRVANRHLVVFVTQRGSMLQNAVDAAPARFADVAQAVIAHDFLRERSIVFERLERLGIHCLDVPSQWLAGRAHQPLSADQATRADMTQADLIDEARIAGLGVAPASGARPELVLKSSEFRKGREEGWRELEDLVRRVERRGVRSLSLDELQQLPILYRAALSSLSVARTIALDRNLLLYLENLALRAYLVVYGPRVEPDSRGCARSSFTTCRRRCAPRAGIFSS